MILTRDKAFITVFSLLTVKDDEKKETSIGTGTFVCKNDNELFLVTASHVAATTNNTSKIIFSGKENKCVMVSLNDLNEKIEWKHHYSADLACLKIKIKDSMKELFNQHFLPLDHINTSRNCVSRDIELTTIGFPNGLGMQGKFLPLTFRSYAASSYITIGRGQSNISSEIFCLENPSVGGYSGAPVFDLGYSMNNNQMTIYGEKTICHGFISATLGDQSGGKIALVTPAFYLLDLINEEQEGVA